MNEIIYSGKHLVTFSVSRHLHNSLELIYCTSGSGQFSFNGEEPLTGRAILLSSPPLQLIPISAKPGLPISISTLPIRPLFHAARF